MQKLIGIFVVVSLVMLAGCSRNRKTMSNQYGLSYCDGSLGKFDIYTIPNAGGLYAIYVVPYQLVSPGDLVTIGITNTSLDSQRILVSQAAVQNNKEIFAGAVPGNELIEKEMIGIKLYNASMPTLVGDKANDNYCTLPMPGDKGSVR